jgi:hypothetical protein
MQRDKAKVENGLRAKGFREESGDHNYFVFHTDKGLKTPVRTKTSHSPKTKVLGDSLLSAIVRQCHLSRTEFLQLVDCPMTHAVYQALLERKGQV